MELLAEGWSMRAACKEVGISRSVAHIWKNGTTVRLKDGSVKVVPPLEPLSIRVISPRFLSEDERVRIADLAAEGLGPTVIGIQLGRSASTISRELRRNLHPSGQYRPFHAHAVAATRRRRRSRLTAASLGKMPTTRARRLISLSQSFEGVGGADLAPVRARRC